MEADGSHCLKWLDTKKPNSVIYICFGTTTKISHPQLTQIAKFLESSNFHFLWVVRKTNKNSDIEEWLPPRFEERTEEKGMIIRGWAPQVLILEQDDIGASVTHCGWNSTLEAICAGKPMVTWPAYADQFYNEKLLTCVLKIGVGVGAKRWSRFERNDDDDIIKWDAIEKAVKKTMEGDEAEEMRKRVKQIACKARQAVEECGSSYSQLDDLIEELTNMKVIKKL